MSTSDWESALSEYIPEHMHGAVARYIESGIPPGSFLSAVLCNNLKEAVFAADTLNINRIPSYVQFLSWYVPAICWGSEDAFTKWIERGGLNGQTQATGKDEWDSDEDYSTEAKDVGC